MATSSIFHDVVIKSKKEAKNLINALELAEAKAIIEQQQATIERLTKERDELREKAVIVELIDEEGYAYQFEHYLCPNCKNVISQRPKGAKTSLYKPECCDDCGQKLLWED